MSAWHALVDEAPACGRKNYHRATTDRANVTCKRCLGRLPKLDHLAAVRAADQRQEALYAEACEALGVSHVWNSLRTHTPTERFMRGVFGAVILGLLETGQVAA